jgi:hypothetical protein
MACLDARSQPENNTSPCVGCLNGKPQRPRVGAMTNDEVIMPGYRREGRRQGQAGDGVPPDALGSCRDQTSAALPRAWKHRRRLVIRRCRRAWPVTAADRGRPSRTSAKGTQRAQQRGEPSWDRRRRAPAGVVGEARPWRHCLPASPAGEARRQHRSGGCPHAGAPLGGQHVSPMATWTRPMSPGTGRAGRALLSTTPVTCKTVTGRRGTPSRKASRVNQEASGATATPRMEAAR